MDIDQLWRLIEQSARETERKQARFEWLRDRLAQRRPEEIVDFKELLSATEKKAYTWLMWGALLGLFGYGGDDGFRYFRLWLVDLGRDAFERVAREPDALVELPAIRHLLGEQSAWLRRPDHLDDSAWSNDEWPDFEWLEFVPDAAWEQATGEDADGLYAAYRARGHDPSCVPQPGGEEWDVYDWDETVRRLPRVGRYLRDPHRGIDD